MWKQASTIQHCQKAHAGIWFLVLESDLSLVGLCLEGDGLETGNSNISFGVGGHQVCHCGLFIVGDGVVLELVVDDGAWWSAWWSAWVGICSSLFR